MNRMTEKTENGYYVPAERGSLQLYIGTFKEDAKNQRYKGSVVDRLGAYEDCGLEPEELKASTLMDEYKGFNAIFYYDFEDGIFVGHITEISDSVSFHGETENEVLNAFRDSVDDYIKFLTGHGN